MKNLILSLITIAMLTTLSCSSCKKETPNPNGLPPTTQTGANTLGFLLNGQPWKPEGFAGNANLSIDVDFSFKNGILGISAYRILSNADRQYFAIGISDSLNFLSIPSSSKIKKTSIAQISFSKTDSCSIDYYDQTVHRDGNFLINKLDKINRIVSGTFNAILYKPNCDTIRITDGRFDMKF